MLRRLQLTPKATPRYFLLLDVVTITGYILSKETSRSLLAVTVRRPIPGSPVCIRRVSCVPIPHAQLPFSLAISLAARLVSVLPHILSSNKSCLLVTCHQTPEMRYRNTKEN